MGIYDRLRLPPAIATEFIGEFMMAEYALKCAGFAVQKNGAASADWDRYSAHISDSFDMLTNVEFRKAVAYLVTNPPRKQSFENDILLWKISSPPADKPAAFQALLMIRRVRNNLFHGGKFGRYQDDFYSPRRDENLVKAAAVVLKHAIALHPMVDAMYQRD